MYMNPLEGTYLSNKTVKAGDIIQFISDCEIVKSNFKDTNGNAKTQMQFEIRLQDGSTRKYSPNFKSIKALAEVWGDTSLWKGKNAIASEGVTPQGARQILWKAM